jgi:hypothetical protein
MKHPMDINKLQKDNYNSWNKSNWWLEKHQPETWGRIMPLSERCKRWPIRMENNPYHISKIIKRVMERLQVIEEEEF